MSGLLRVMITAPRVKSSGKKELAKYIDTASAGGVNLLIMPSSFLPYYKNSNAFYSADDITGLPRAFPRMDPSMHVAVGVNYEHGATSPNAGVKKKRMVLFNKDKIVAVHEKSILEDHYVQKGFEPGAPSEPIMIKGVRVLMRECYETLFPYHDTTSLFDLLVGSIGFGMKAKTDHYDCDYYEQWLTIVRAGCIRNQCFAALSCNAIYKDALSVVVNPEGELIACVRTSGHAIVDIDVSELARDPKKNPY